MHALRALYASGGTATAVTEDELRQAIRRMASRGFFFESASVATIASLVRLHADGYFKPGETVVCVITGSGVKWPTRSINLCLLRPTWSSRASLLCRM